MLGTHVVHFLPQDFHDLLDKKDNLPGIKWGREEHL
jgi:hypothetical protein